MLEEEGVVTAVEGRLARVQVQPRSACGHCQARSGCGTSLVAGFLGRRPGSFWAHNPLGARPGDQVVIGLDEAELRRASLLLYLLPILALVAGAVAGDRLGPQGTEWPAILGALGGLALALVAVGRTASGGRHRRPRILRILPPGVGLSLEVKA